MAILEILHYPDPRLRIQAKPVEGIGPELSTLIEDLWETMYQEGGIGLAATQVNAHKRVLVIDLSEQRNQPMYLINPEIIEQEGWEEMQEGCLSVPGVFEQVRRAERIRVRSLTLEGKLMEQRCDGLLAVCIQHEIDHLDGKLFIDRLSSLKRRRIRKKLEKQQRLPAAAVL